MKRIKFAGPAFLLLVAVYLVSGVLLGVYPHELLRRLLIKDALVAEITAAQGQWQEAGITHYRMILSYVNYSGPASPFCPGTVLEVSNGVVMRDELVRQAPEQPTDMCLPIYQQATVDDLFNYVVKTLRQTGPMNTSLAVSFDPGIGYISSLDLQVLPTILDPVIYGDQRFERVLPTRLHIRVHDFVQLNP